MRNVQYGSKTIRYEFLEQEKLETHYISVNQTSGVILKGKQLPSDKADMLILKKARWILGKLTLVGRVSENQDIVTGSRIQYLGKGYYVEVLLDATAPTVEITFNYSKFIIRLRDTLITQAQIREKLEEFYKIKAAEKITPRMKKLSAGMKLPYKSLRFLKMDKRWGSCSKKNEIVLNTAAVKLPYTMIDYLIVHELTHIIVKNHSKSFYKELSKYLVDWEDLDNKFKAHKLSD